MDVGTNVWVKTQDAAVWAAATVVNCKDVNGFIQVHRLDTDEVVTCRASDTLCLRSLSTDLVTTQVSRVSSTSTKRRYSRHSVNATPTTRSTRGLATF
ncbi:hypothetical protein PsorP6_009412 [Peronosclerospora sorghi]|uniref:Uncharacterized protein n=1 Tax=Peronosclerospora sorghi TaxID=230839 RepID=A0ACC0VZT4_9STRA|nr:hypothetical protein PsorP6_009412 [Peronosclerospora sorghi]